MELKDVSKPTPQLFSRTILADVFIAMFPIFMLMLYHPSVHRSISLSSALARTWWKANAMACWLNNRVGYVCHFASFCMISLLLNFLVLWLLFQKNERVLYLPALVMPLCWAVISVLTTLATDSVRTFKNYTDSAITESTILRLHTLFYRVLVCKRLSAELDYSWFCVGSAVSSATNFLKDQSWHTRFSQETIKWIEEQVIYYFSTCC